MSSLDLATYIDFLHQELADMPVIAMSSLRQAGLMRGPLPPRHVEEARDAMKQLLATSGGGVLVLPIVDSVLAPSRERVVKALCALAEEMAPGCVGEAIPVDLTEGPGVALRLEPPEVVRTPEVPDEMQTVEDAESYELDQSRLVDLGVPPASLSEDDDSTLTPAERAMIRLGAAVERDGLAVPTVAGLVALGHRPYRRLPGMRVWLQAGRGEWVEDSLPDLLANLARHDALRGFPPAMVKEMVLNAMVHRDWSPAARTLPVRVLVAGRRLEVASPGALGSADWPPNPRLRALVRHLGLARGQGKGLARIADELGHRGWPEIEVLELDGEVSVAVERKVGPSLRSAPAIWSPVPLQARPAPRAPTPPPSRPSAPALVATRLAPRPVEARGTVVPTPRETRSIPKPAPAPPPDAASVRDAAVVALAREQGTVTSRGVQERLGWSRSSTRDTLARLVAAGTLERLASSSRSPNQSYRLRA